MKNQGKSDKIFLSSSILHSTDDKITLYSFSSSRTRVRARVPTAMLIFCCHKCHTMGKIRPRNSRNSKQEMEVFSRCFGPCLSRCNDLFVKTDLLRTVII